MKKKILFIAPHLSTGGMPQYLYKQMESVKNDMDIYCVEWDNVTGGVLVVQRNKVVNLLDDKLFTLGENKEELFSIINKINPDIIHLQEIPEMFMQGDIADKLYSPDRKYILVETSHDSGYNTENKVYLPDKFLMVSKYQMKMYESLGVPCDIVEYPIEYKTRTKTREEALRDLGLDPNLKHVINVGLFTPRKNQAEVITYARELQEHPIQFHFIGNQADNFKFYWEPLMQNFPSNCKWWNERSDVDSFYEAADLMLFTSRGSETDHETMPLVIREALGWKTPSMIYNLPAYMDYFDDFDTIEYLRQDTQQNATRIAEKLLQKYPTNELNYKFIQTKTSNNSRYAIIVLFDENYQELADVALPNIIEYAKLHGYDVISFHDKIDPSRPPQWSKIKAVQYVLNSYNYEWVWMTDVDAIIMNDSIKIEHIVDNNYDMVMTSNKIATVTNGSSFYRNSKLTREFLEECYSLKRDILQHIDVNAFDWDLQPIRQLYLHVPKYRERIKLVHERVCNSFWYTTDATVLTSFPDWNQWDSIYQPGDFLVNFCGRHKTERVELMKQFVTEKGKGKIYYTMKGEEKLGDLSYFNSTMENLTHYGDAAAQYYANFHLKELEQNNIVIKENDVFVDLGANIGMSSVYAMSKNVSEIHCFEPDPNMITLIRKNVPSAKIHPYAISEKETDLELYHWPYNPVNEGPKYKCKGISLKQVLTLVGKKIDYLKMDIEGFETTVFNDITLEECANIDRIMIEYHKEDGLENFCDVLKSKGFEIDYIGRGYQSYIYAKYTGKIMKKDYGFNSRWDLNEQTIYYSTQQTIDFPVIITLREYKSDAVLWSCEYDSLAPGGEYWMTPVAKNWHSYIDDPNFMGVKFCIYRKDTEEQIYEMPFVHTFVNLPTVTLSNTIPYGVNYVEFYINHKYDHWLSKPHGLVVDVGANVGVFTKYMLDSGFARNSVMIECDVKALRDLNRYFRNNPTVTIIPKALHYSSDPVIFYHSPENPVISSTLSPDQLKNHMAGVKGNVEHKVDTITIKDLTNKYGIIDLLKIDVEGAEYEIIERAEDSLFTNIRTLMIECHFFEDDAPQKYTKLVNKLYRLGYTVEEFMENQVNTKMGTSENIYAYKK